MYPLAKTFMSQPLHTSLDISLEMIIQRKYNDVIKHFAKTELRGT